MFGKPLCVFVSVCASWCRDLQNLVGHRSYPCTVFCTGRNKRFVKKKTSKRIYSIRIVVINEIDAFSPYVNSNMNTFSGALTLQAVLVLSIKKKVL